VASMTAEVGLVLFVAVVLVVVGEGREFFGTSFPPPQ